VPGLLDGNSAASRLQIAQYLLSFCLGPRVTHAHACARHARPRSANHTLEISTKSPMVVWAAVFLVGLLGAGGPIPGAAQMPGMDKKPKAPVMKTDLKYILCATCEELAKTLHRDVKTMREELPAHIKKVRVVVVVGSWGARSEKRVLCSKILMCLQGGEVHLLSACVGWRHSAALPPPAQRPKP
jgi:hypothetical protein